jgi:hypothetical protein
MTARKTEADADERDWRRWVGDSEGRPELLCLRCGQKYAVNVPVSLGIIAAIAKAFLKEHERCRP